jgi:putative endopeptidase
MTHGFDDQGRKYDANGNHADWWTAEDAAQFKARSDKLARQFDTYAPIPSKPDVHVNGKLTLGENIADLGGLLAAYDAYQAADKDHAGEKVANYTGNQRVFLAYARSFRNKARDESVLTQLKSDPHSPDALRVNGVVPNVPGFAAAFGCAQTDAMVNGGDKLVSIW